MAQVCRRTALLAGVALLTATAVAGCAPSSGSGGPAGVHDPTEADLAAVKQKMAALPHVTDVALGFKPSNFTNPPYYSIDVTSDAADQATLDATLDSALKVLWNSADLVWGGILITVKNPDTGAYSVPQSIGLETVTGTSMQARYGPRPKP